VYVDPSWSPNGRLIAFTSAGSGPDDLFVMRADGTRVRQLTHAAGAGGASMPAWSSDSRTIAFDYGYDGIWVVNVDGTGLRPILRHGCCAAWSPGGRRLAYARGGEIEPASIYVARPDGTGAQVVASPPENHSLTTPTWSPDGQKLAFDIGQASDLGFNVRKQLGIISRYGGPITKIAAGTDPFEPDWSRDGRRIVFSDQFREVAVLDLRTRKVRRLRPGQHPSWSPGASTIVFSTVRGGIYAMNADGSHVRRLLPK
jgi:Tol biopolymer transport system component